MMRVSFFGGLATFIREPRTQNGQQKKRVPLSYLKDLSASASSKSLTSVKPHRFGSTASRVRKLQATTGMLVYVEKWTLSSKCCFAMPTRKQNNF